MTGRTRIQLDSMFEPISGLHFRLSQSQSTSFTSSYRRTTYYDTGIFFAGSGSKHLTSAQAPPLNRSQAIFFVKIFFLLDPDSYFSNLSKKNLLFFGNFMALFGSGSFTKKKQTPHPYREGKVQKMSSYFFPSQKTYVRVLNTMKIPI